ncbi:MAG TPA: YeeE/YedE thiosulfate transporter family protein [Bacteroidota bacterium]|nr:YeeE/YedE thiosulfate transporter family protein [Bacteroidota bacterium]
MGPLVPEMIGNELNYIVALLIGIAFGFVLEQAGFSSSRKLAGIFYGYDFTVLRVFFTAAATAMAGSLILGYLGLLDMEVIYVNPTYVWAAIVGGAIMGLGFVVGGYCPGTSVCAAAIGKIDAIVFVIGSILGVLFFAEGYSAFEGLYTASFLGNLKVYNSIGMSEGAFALFLVAAALSAFYATDWIEAKVTARTEKKPARLRKQYALFTVLALGVGVMLVFMPDRKTAILNESMNDAYVGAQPVESMTSDELAYRLLDGDAALQVIDVRPASEFERMTLPTAMNVQRENFFSKEWNEALSLKHKRRVLIAQTEMDERRADAVARALGVENTCVLKGGLGEFESSILRYTSPAQITDGQTADTDRFRLRAAPILAKMIAEAKNKPKVVKIARKIAGGC